MATGIVQARTIAPLEPSAEPAPPADDDRLNVEGDWAAEQLVPVDQAYEVRLGDPADQIEVATDYI